MRDGGISATAVARQDRGAMDEHFRFLDVELHLVTRDAWLREVADWVESGTSPRIGLGCNLHSLHALQGSSELRSVFRRADRVHIDGMGVVLFAKLLGAPASRRHRLAALDWIGPLLRTARDRGWRVFFLGGRPQVGQDAAEALQRRIPGLRFAHRHGYFDLAREAPEQQHILGEIAAYSPDILLVGMGVGRQEPWVVRHRAQLGAPAILTIGACMDYIAGRIRTPPRWLGRVGLEWAFRLATEPKRLWRRYLLEPWSLAPDLLRALLWRV